MQSVFKTEETNVVRQKQQFSALSPFRLLRLSLYNCPADMAIKCSSEELLEAA